MEKLRKGNAYAAAVWLGKLNRAAINAQVHTRRSIPNRTVCPAVCPAVCSAAAASPSLPTRPPQAPPNDPNTPATVWQKWIMRIYDDKEFYVEGGYVEPAATAPPGSYCLP